MLKKVFIVLCIIVFLLFFLSTPSYSTQNHSTQNHSCRSHFSKCDVSEIVLPEQLSVLDSYPVEIIVHFNKDSIPETFKAWLNKNNITDKFEPIEGGMRALVGPEDGLIISVKGEHKGRPKKYGKHNKNWRSEKNKLTTVVRRKKRILDHDQIKFLVEVDAMANIGPEGGVIEITNPESSLYGLNVEIPPDILSENTIITIAETDFNMAISEKHEFFLVFPPIKIGPEDMVSNSDSFKITIPYHDDDDDDIIDGTLFSEEFISIYCILNDMSDEMRRFEDFSIDYINNKINIETQHFSHWIPWVRRWKKNTTIYYNIQSLPASPNSEDIIIEAFDKWNQALRGVLTFEYGPDTNPCDILIDTIDFCDNNYLSDTFCGSAANTNQWFYNGDGLAYDVKISFSNDDWLWSSGTECPYPSGDFPFLRIALREIGHALGLPEYTILADLHPDYNECLDYETCYDSCISSEKVIMKDDKDDDDTLRWLPFNYLSPFDIAKIEKLYNLEPIIDSDNDGFTGDIDCEDYDDKIYPDAPELCDGKDNNCDGILPDCEKDIDKDGIMACENDCDDYDPDKGDTEICGDNIDNNCDGQIDEGCVSEITYSIPDTGQTKCYDKSQEILCPNEGKAFYGQDSQYGTNTQFYTKLDANGYEGTNPDGSWSMVRDDVTGLIWEVKTDDGSIHDKDNTYSWYDSNPATNGGDAGTSGDDTDTEDFINELNIGNFGGFSDWRLPTINELSFIVDRGKYNPAINKIYFPLTVPSSYWSSTPFVDDSDSAWRVHFHAGISSDYFKSTPYYVRAVRGTQIGSSDNFIINGDGTVTDQTTGLMWQQGTSTEMNWRSALAYCEDLFLAGYTDWRLPNINELKSIENYNNINPTIDSTFTSTPSKGFWSSTTYTNNSLFAWYVLFSNGSDNGYSKTSNYYVRAVRDEQ